jgi:peptidoglycan/LPS O-acetylase OafA/YrhL
MSKAMKRISELDGLRCFAVLAVIAVHYRPPRMTMINQFLAMGWAGVDLFFAISGFLITTILLGMRGTPHPFRTFYARRTARIFPPYYAVLCLILMIALSQHRFIPRLLGFGGLFFAPSLAPQAIVDAWRHIFISHALDHSTASIDLHQLHEITEGLFVIWSLSVEEIFYLLWAPIVLCGSRRFIAVCAVLPIFLCPVLRVFAHSPNFPEYTSFFFRVDSLCAGACVALLFRTIARDPQNEKHLGRALKIGVLFAAAILAAIFWSTNVAHGVEIRSTLLFAFLGYTALALFSCGIVGLCAMHSGGRSLWLRILRLTPVLYIGTVSYVIYLIHVPVYVATRAAMIRVGASSISAGPLSLLALGLTVTLASLSWRYFERPILAWKDRRFERHLLPDPQDTAILHVTEMGESGVTPQPS